MLGTGLGSQPTTECGIFGTNTALGLDGNSDYVELPSGFKSGFNTAAGSASLWINLVENDGGTSQTVFRIQADSDNFFQFFYHKHYTEWRTAIKTDGTVQTATYDVPGSSNNDGSGYDDGWQHFVATFSITDGACALKLYRNGSIIQTTTASGQEDWIGSIDYAVIGSTQGTSGFVDGYIDQVAFYNGVLSPDNVTAIYNSGVPIDLTTFHTDYSVGARSLYAYYQFEGNALDSSSNRFHATLRGTASVNNKVQPDD